jgi:glycosyltransferase involved in cell wall biosynthesis
MSVKLSVVIITLNEENIIAQCISAANKVADEVLVVDSYSTDRTKEICLEKGAKFVEHPFQGHIQQKNYAASQAKYEHVLSLDADEIISEELSDGILAVKQNWAKDAYYLLRRSYYCGKFVNYGDWYPDRKIRLFKKSAGEWAGINPHDTYQLFDKKTLGRLKGDLEHYTFNTVWAHIEQANKFSSIGARELVAQKAKVNIFTLMLHPAWRVFRSYVLRLGFLDGLRGYSIALIIGMETFLKYLKVIWPVDKAPFNDSRILQISSIKSWRGGEQQVAYLATELRKLGKESLMVVAKNSKLEQFCKQNHFKYYTISFGNGFNLYSAWKLRQICSRNQIDLVHMQCSPSHTLGVFSNLLGNRAELVLSRRVDFPIRQNKFSILKYNYSGIKRIICVSHKIQKVISPDIIHKEKIITVHSGIDLTKFNGSPANTLRQQFNVKDNHLLIGNVASMANHKDYFTFIDTAEILLANGFIGTFLIIGDDGGEEKAIREYIKEKQLEASILITGFRTDIPEILPELDIFLFTSKEEGLGTSILDAMASGVPIVATRAGGVPEMVENGVNGFLCDIQHPEQLAKSMLLLSEDETLRTKFIDNAHETVKHFSKEKTALKTLEQYVEVLHQEPLLEYELNQAY